MSRQTLPRLDALIAEGATTVEIKSGYGLDLANERKTLRVAQRLERERRREDRQDLSGRARVAARGERRQGRLYRHDVVDQMLPALAREGPDRRRRRFLRRHRFFAGARWRACSKRRGRSNLPVKLHADQLSNLHGAALAARFGALSADHLEHTDEAGAAAMAQAGTVAVLLPGAFYFIRETKLPPIDAFRKAGVRMALATDCNPGTSPLTSLLLTMNMARDAVSTDGRGMHRRRHARGGASARAASSNRHAGSRARSPISRSGRSSGPPSSSIASVSIRCSGASGVDDEPRS